MAKNLHLRPPCLPEDDRVGSKHAGGIMKLNEEKTNCVYLGLSVPLLILEVHCLR